MLPFLRFKEGNVWTKNTVKSRLSPTLHPLWFHISSLFTPGTYW